jgi:hypothetical protein
MNDSEINERVAKASGWIKLDIPEAENLPETWLPPTSLKVFKAGTVPPDFLHDECAAIKALNTLTSRTSVEILLHNKAYSWKTYVQVGLDDPVIDADTARAICLAVAQHNAKYGC